MKTRPYIAVVIPMSRTRPARSPNDSASTSRRPNRMTSKAPDTLNRSVVVVFMEAFRP